MADEILTEVKFEAKDLASASSEKIARGFEKVSAAARAAEMKVTGWAKSAAVAAAAGLGVSVGFRSIATAVYGANVELGRVQKQITGALFGFQSWNKALTTVDRVKISQREMIGVTRDLEKAEARLALPLESLGSTFRTVAGPAFQKLGMNQKQVTDLTIKAAEASKIFGVSSEHAGMQVTRALVTGRVRGMDPFSNKLREVLGNTKGLSSPQIWARMERGLRDLSPAADAMSQGLDDISKKIKNTFISTLRDVGAPTVKHIGGLMQRLNSYMEETVAGGKRFEVVGQQILRVFQGVEKVVGFVGAHWKGLVAAFAGYKLLGLANRVSGGAGGLLGGGATSAAVMNVTAGVVNVGGASGLLGKGAGAARGALGLGAKTGLLGLAGMAGLGIGAGAVALGHGLANLREGRAMDFGKEWKNAAGELKDSVSYLAREGMDTIRDKLSFGAGQIAMAGTNLRHRALAQGMGGGVYAPGMAPGEVVRRGWKSGLELDPHPKVNPRAVQNFYGGIHITQDFKDQDPDRVFVRFKSDLEAQAANPQTAMGTGPGLGQ